MALMRAARVLCAAAAGALLYAVLDSRLGTAGDLEIFLAAARAERPYDAGSVLAAMKAGGRVVRWVEEWAGRGCSPFFYPPGIWHAMRPMRRMDRGAAFLLLALLNAGAMAAMAVRAPAAARRDFVILALPTLAMNIALGQVNLILAAMADAGLAGLAASCKPFALAGARPGRRIREAALLAGLLAAQWAAFGDLFREWLSNLPCLERLGDPGGAVGAWQAGVRALLPLPAPLARFAWAAGLLAGGPLGLAAAAFLSPASWIPYDAFFLPLLRERLKEGASPVLPAAWMLMAAGGLPFLPPALAAAGRLALLTDSTLCGIKKGKGACGGIAPIRRLFSSHPYP
jgi:hypothetical protein